MKHTIDTLTEIQKKILKNRILTHPEQPFGFNTGTVHTDPGMYTKYSADELKNALNDLVDKAFLTLDGEGSYYIFSREQFLRVRTHFSFLLRFDKIWKNSKIFASYLWKHFIVTIIVASITAYITTLIYK